MKREPTQAEQVGYDTVPVTNSFVNTAKVWVEVSDLSAYSGYTGRADTVRPGQRELKVPVKFAGDDLFIDDELRGRERRPGDGRNLELLIEPDGTFITEPITLRAWDAT